MPKRGIYLNGRYDSVSHLGPIVPIAVAGGLGTSSTTVSMLAMLVPTLSSLSVSATSINLSSPDAAMIAIASGTSTNGVHSMTANQTVLDWRREWRLLWNLDVDPKPYDTYESYAQPQRQDWPVYDVANGIYVQWPAETSHFESMLELNKEECEQLRCVSIYSIASVTSEVNPARHRPTT